MTTTTRRVRQSTHEFAATVSGKPAEAAQAPEALEHDRTPEVEPVVRATHVEAPALDGERRYPELYGTRTRRRRAGGRAGGARADIGTT